MRSLAERWAIARPGKATALSTPSSLRAASDIARITGRGWYDLSASGGFHHKLSAVGNPVAAMPSLHTAIAVFVALYAITRLRSPWRWLLLLYPLAMSFMLVYYAEHYVIDIVAGFIAAGLVLWGCDVWERWRQVPAALVGAEVAFPSVQVDIAPGGHVEVVSTHEQLLGGP